MPRRKVLSWALLALLFAQTACGGLLAGAQWGARGRAHADAGFNLFTPEQDVELGDASAEEIARQLSLLRDARTNAYVQRLRAKIAAAGPGDRCPHRVL